MLERFAVSVATTTILAVLGKLAFLYHDAHDGNGVHVDWFSMPAVPQGVVGTCLVGVFLMFFRGKMMHDDATFFADLARPAAFRNDRRGRAAIKILLPLSYLSWLLWAPAIYFLDTPERFSWCLIASLVLSTACLALDLTARKVREWRRVVWGVPNVLYIVGLLVFAYTNKPNWAAWGLVVVLLIDWIITDPFSGLVSTQQVAATATSTALGAASKATDAAAKALKVTAKALEEASVAIEGELTPSPNSPPPRQNP